MSGPLVALVVDELDDDDDSAFCCCTARSASACPSSPSGLFARRPAVGSKVTFLTGGAG